jgi:hypothetical protein
MVKRWGRFVYWGALAGFVGEATLRRRSAINKSDARQLYICKRESNRSGSAFSDRGAGGLPRLLINMKALHPFREIITSKKFMALAWFVFQKEKDHARLFRRGRRGGLDGDRFERIRRRI